MVMTRGQWEALQRRLPPEDRESYENYLKSEGLSTAPATPLAAAEGGLIAAQSMYTQTTGQPAPTVTTPTTPLGMSIESQRYTAAAIAAGLNPAFDVAAVRIGEEKDRPTPASTVTPTTVTSTAAVTTAVTTTATAAVTAVTTAAVSTTTINGKEYTKEELAKLRQQWSNLMNRFPAEDRISFEDWLSGKEPVTKVSTAAVTAAVTAVATAAVTAVSTAAVTAVATAAVTAAVTAATTVAATAAVTAAATVAATAAVTATVTAAVTAVSTAAVTAVSTAAVTAAVSIVDSQYLGTGASRVLRTYYSNGTFTDTAAPELVKGGASEQDAATLELLKQLQAQNAALMAQMAAAQQQAQADAKAAAEAAAKEKRESAIAVLTNRFTRYGLASLVPKIRELATKGASQDTITLELQETDEYQERFKANKDRIKKGLSVLDPGEYLGLEDSYRQILRAYGLRQFDTDAYVSQFISNDVSTAELSSRVQLAVQRVKNADPATLDMLNKYYKIGETDLVAYALDPETQFQKFERQVAAAEIGAAAELQGIKPGVAVAEQLAAQGVTQAEARKGYSTIADILPTSEKLSQIYGNVLEGYGLAEAEQEVFNSLASAQRKRRKLTEREIAAFSGQSGTGRTSLTQQTGGTI
jgi:hypothetical protein